MEKELKVNYPRNRDYWLSKPSENFGRFLVWQILGGLQLCRSALFLHKDLSLKNLFLTKTFQLKIGDLGCFERLKEEEIVNLGEHGTPNYMSPEYFQKYNNVSYNNAYKIDYYALGVSIYYMLTSKYPIEINKHIKVKPKENTQLKDEKVLNFIDNKITVLNQNQLYYDLVNEINLCISNIDNLNISKSLQDLLKSTIILII